MEDATGHPRGLPPVVFYCVEKQGRGELRKRASISHVGSAAIRANLSIDRYGCDVGIFPGSGGLGLPW